MFNQIFNQGFNQELNLITDDTNIVYDPKTHRYIMTIAGAKALTGIDATFKYGGIDQANALLNRISRTVYNYVYSKLPRTDIQILEYRISRQQDLAYAILEAMVAMLEADDLNGAAQIAYQHGLDTGIGSQDIANVQVPVIVHNVLRNEGLFARYGIHLIPADVYRVGY